MLKTKVLCSLKRNKDITLIVEIEDNFAPSNDNDRKFAAYNQLVRFNITNMSYKQFIETFTFTFE